MTIRSGGRPRDTRAHQARPYAPDAYAPDSIPEFSEPVPGPRGGGGRGGHGIVGFPKFLGFPLGLGGADPPAAPTAPRPGRAPPRPPPWRRRRGQDDRR